MTPFRPQPWTSCPPQALRAVVGVLTDIDDTLTTDGAITQDALAALQALRAAGLPVMAITGRPMGWSRPFAGGWPGVPHGAANRAVGLLRARAGGPVEEEYAQDPATRARNAVRLRQAAARVLGEVPGSQLARDSAGRVTDIAIDHGEFSHLSPSQIEQVLAVVRAEGLTASVSSIHVNAWIGDPDKLSGARWLVRRLLGRDLDAERGRWVFVGDSTNDQRLFGHLPLSVGVANLRRFERELRVWPRYIAQAERGAGFAEVAAAILRARGA